MSKTKVRTIFIDGKLYRKLEKNANATGKTIEQYVEYLLKEHAKEGI